jgi:hypothetical protein
MRWKHSAHRPSSLHKKIRPNCASRRVLHFFNLLKSYLPLVDFFPYFFPSLIMFQIEPCLWTGPMKCEMLSDIRVASNGLYFFPSFFPYPLKKAPGNFKL